MRHLWTNDTDTYIAERAEDVLDLWEAHNGEPYDPEDGAWEMVDDDKRLEVGHETREDVLDTLHDMVARGAKLDQVYVVERTMAEQYMMREPPPGYTRWEISATAEWWALGESGFLCSTEW